MAFSYFLLFFFWRPPHQSSLSLSLSLSLWVFVQQRSKGKSRKVFPLSFPLPLQIHTRPKRSGEEGEGSDGLTTTTDRRRNRLSFFSPLDPTEEDEEKQQAMSGRRRRFDQVKEKNPVIIFSAIFFYGFSLCEFCSFFCREWLSSSPVFSSTLRPLLLLRTALAFEKRFAASSLSSSSFFSPSSISSPFSPPPHFRFLLPRFWVTIFPSDASLFPPLSLLSREEGRGFRELLGVKIGKYILHFKKETVKWTKSSQFV